MSRIYEVEYTPAGDVLLTLGRRPPVQLCPADAIHLASLLVEIAHHGAEPIRGDSFRKSRGFLSRIPAPTA